MDLIKVGEARDFLIRSEEIKKCIESINTLKLTEDVKLKLDLLKKLIEFCEFSEKCQVYIEKRINLVLDGMALSEDEIKKIVKIVIRCQKILIGYLREMNKRMAYVRKSPEYVDYTDAIRKYIKEKSKKEKSKKEKSKKEK